MTTSSNRPRRAIRFFAYLLLFFLILVCFVGGFSAILFEIFTTSSTAKYSWLLLCGGPVVLVTLVVFVLFNLYMRFGQPLEQLFKTINAVEAGDLSARVPENNSDMFSDLIKRFNRMVGELERAEQQRRNLTADIAHELRTPLHIIQGNLEGVLDGVYQPTGEHINATLDETRLLTRLVNDLQTLSLAETGQLPLHPTRFLLADLIADLTSSFSSQAASLGIDLRTSLADPNQQITADYDRLNQVLSNLITNALRHTPQGGTVSILIESTQHESHNTQYATRITQHATRNTQHATRNTQHATHITQHATRITIQDTGSGIPPEDLPFIFDRFWRADKSRSERTHSGLGLAITKQLIHAHGGTIEAQSDGVPGKGSNFIIELPDH